MEMRLLACPFCGGTGKIHTNKQKMPQSRASHLWRWWVECQTCFALTIPRLSEAEAIGMWQRRFDATEPRSAPQLDLTRLT